MLKDGRLSIFKKFKKSDNNARGTEVSFGGNSSWVHTGNTTTGNTTTGSTTAFDNTTIYAINGATESKFKNVLKLFKISPKAVLVYMITYMFSPEKFFKQVKRSLLHVKRITIRSEETIDVLISQAKAVGQTSFAETLEEERERINKELKLVDNGYDIYIKEDDIIKFQKYSNKSLKLDWIKNFNRLIPFDILKQIDHAISLGVFDNFVILHYDPLGENSKPTKKEVEKAKDPIVFGVMECSNSLYYIGDWIDEFCDLTLDVLLETIKMYSSDRKLDNETIVNGKKDNENKEKR